MFWRHPDVVYGRHSEGRRLAVNTLRQLVAAAYMGHVGARHHFDLYIPASNEDFLTYPDYVSRRSHCRIAVSTFHLRLISGLLPAAGYQME
jgi:hypothetical protein